MAKSQETQTGKKPTHRLYRVTGDGENSSWTPIGAAWLHRDGNGFSIQCGAVPLQGRIVMRHITERTPAEGGQQ